MRISARARRIEPFYVMEVAKAAAALAQQAADTERPMVFLNIGEPDFGAPPLVRLAAERALRDGATQYTQATGMASLRERISHWYLERFGLQVPASRIVVTAGASAGLQLVCLALIETGDEMLMPDPSYPCNRHFVSAADGRAVLIPSTAAERFALSADKVQAAWGERTRGVLLASPSNPTGTSIDPAELRRIHNIVQARGGITLVDEIYLGLSFEPQFGQSALAIDEQIISINSFSKYFSMTGWRLGWLVMPPSMTAQMGKLIEFNTSCVSVFTQRAGIAALENTESITPAVVAHLKLCRDTLIPLLQSIPGLEVSAARGGMYAFFKLAGHSDSLQTAKRLVAEAGLGLAPGEAFAPEAKGWLRWCFASRDPQRLVQGVDRLRRWLAAQA
ncbi:MAG: aminotransferase class I/II-fold pyridoxal phosphate-dependent enzyme [Betaproteobacteria bacterium]|nr:aminotransferase class I/II-fold pyridoxal phosphate-dependent enzyme [Betaproteobacteria bacterium]